MASEKDTGLDLRTKRIIIAVLSGVFLLSLLFVQWMEVTRKRAEVGLAEEHVSVPASSEECAKCHGQTTPALVSHWKGSTHAEKGVGCVECHQAADGDVDGFDHYGAHIATIVTPKDCSRCHTTEAEEFAGSHHAKGGNILASLDNFLAETVEGHRGTFDPHSPTPGMAVDEVDGFASAFLGCKQCHGSLVGLKSIDGGILTVRDLEPGPDGQPTNLNAAAKVLRNENGLPVYDPSTWPNTGIGRINLDGSLGSCSACHSRHDFSPRRARQPESCGKCHMGPDHPQKEIYEESKHGVAFRDLKDEMNLDADEWVLGEDYSAAPTCATCHTSGNRRNEGKISHDPRWRISWNNRPPVSVLMDTNSKGEIVTETDPDVRRKLVVDTWQDKRARMKEVCSHCHTLNYANAFFKQYDSLVLLYNEKFGKPGKKIMASLRDAGLITPTQFDEEIEWTWFYLWHDEGRRARHGASMMGPDYTHWHGMRDVAERFYMEMVPQVRELIEHAREQGHGGAADQVEKVLEDILDREEHQWFEKEKAAIDTGPGTRKATGAQPSGTS